MAQASEARSELDARAAKKSCFECPGSLGWTMASVCSMHEICRGLFGTDVVVDDVRLHLCRSAVRLGGICHVEIGGAFRLVLVCFVDSVVLRANDASDGKPWLYRTYQHKEVAMGCCLSI